MVAGRVVLDDGVTITGCQITEQKAAEVVDGAVLHDCVRLVPELDRVTGRRVGHGDLVDAAARREIRGQRGRALGGRGDGDGHCDEREDTRTQRRDDSRSRAPPSCPPPHSADAIGGERAASR